MNKGIWAKRYRAVLNGECVDEFPSGGFGSTVSSPKIMLVLFGRILTTFTILGSWWVRGLRNGHKSAVSK